MKEEGVLGGAGGCQKLAWLQHPCLGEKDKGEAGRIGVRGRMRDAKRKAKARQIKAIGFMGNCSDPFVQLLS